MIKAACHIHSDWSYDGSWPLEKLASAFEKRGYGVLLMTEHDREFSDERLSRYRESCARASSNKILLIPGIEYSDDANRVHILVWGPVPFLGESVPTSSLLRAAHDANGVAVLAHPTRRDAWSAFDPAWSEHLLGIEVWNRKTDGWAPSRTAPEIMGDGRLLSMVGLDFHTWRQFFPLSLELDLAQATTEDAVLDALRLSRYTPNAFGLDVRKLPGRTGAIPSLAAAEKLRRIVAYGLR